MRSAVASLLMLLSAGPVSAESGSTRIIEIIGERSAEERPNAGASSRVVVGEACGSRQDDWFCGSVAPQSTSYVSSGLSASALRGETVLVTWNGTIACELRPAAARGVDAGRIEFSVELALVDDGPDVGEPAGEGRARIGRRLRVDPAASTVGEAAILDVHPVSLTRAFLRRRGGAQVYRVRIDGAFRAGTGTCTVSGGAMTATIAER